MTKSIEKSIVKSFIVKFACSSGNGLFPKEFKRYEPKQFLQEYYDFLGYSCFKYSGMLYTGVYLVWRAVIKYLEELQQDEDFKNLKGKLLENWCYRKAEKYGFSAEKIIITNTLSKPTPRYFEMREQIKEFPKKPIEIEVEFHANDQSYYREIDLAFRIQDHLFLFECKGTSAPIGEEGKFFSWGFHFEKNMDSLSEKASILYYNIKNGIIEHPFLKGVEITILEIIKTEGLLANYGVMFPIEFEQSLKTLREEIDKNNYDEYFEKAFKDFGSE